jgi:cob(I)alamin adenosyltransferase
MTDRSTDPLAAPASEPPAAPGAKRRAPVPKQKRPGPYRVPKREDRHGLLIVNTGDGKGKTTAALGLLLRATGRGMRVGMFQFMKSVAINGEHAAAERLGLEIELLGAGCTRGKHDTTQDRALAVEGWARCHAALAGGAFDILVFDELTFPLTWGWLDVTEVLAAIVARPTGTHVVVTGRDAHPALVVAADLVTEMRVVKHPYRDRGERGQPGIDW